uniref:Uncharacterized protein n=1 Tax=Trypanosoma vivax (strain Y486) TaxID=1055687 RepID=G0U605_TRYVY|nr:conserved hypothetical protein [Trypanosoma vivax Y486]
MFRITSRRWTEVADTCVPSNFVHATDLAFYFPRFQPRSHLQTHGIPELRDAVELLQPAANVPGCRWTAPRTMATMTTAAAAAAEWRKSRDKALTLLARGAEIIENVGGARNKALVDVVRPLYATKFELINGVEHLPRSDLAQRLDVHRTILKQAGRLLYFGDDWDRLDLKQLDTSCVIAAHFVRSFCALHQRPFHSEQGSGEETAVRRNNANLSAWSISVGGESGCGEALTLPLVMNRIDELLKLSQMAAEKHGRDFPDIRWTPPKLLPLKGILTIPLTGNLARARELVDDAAKVVYEFNRRAKPILEGLTVRKQEPELGLFMLAQAEIAARVFDWSLPPNEVDMGVIGMFEAAAKFYSSPCNTALNADGIMSTENLDERRFEAEAYVSCMLSYGTFMLNAPRPPGKSSREKPVFLPKQVFSTSPIATVATSSDIIYTDVQQPAPMTVEVTRKRAGEALERGLSLNRQLFPEQKQNPKAAWTLLSMASLYADTRDYLYATGLFASAEKAVVENYGSASLERLLVLKLRYEFLAGVGSEQEAKVAAHEVVQLLKRIDSMHC